MTNIVQSIALRPLDEFEVFIRQNKALTIVHKVLDWNKSKKTLAEVVSPRKPFGLATNYEPADKGIPCYFIQKIGLKYAKKSDVQDNNNYINKWKFLAPKSPIAGQTDFSKPVGFYYDGNTRIAPPGTCCTESFLVLFASDSEQEVKFFKTYLFTKIVRFLLLQCVVSQDITREKFFFVPDFGQYITTYTDKKLRSLWEISEDEWQYIDSRITDIEKGGEDE